ncbi:DUF4331 family protein [Thalassoroseus pseudoceratinae]|uniref:DUF4331 family protein n=1 Tax=Thalassoroseus pseudoceratinae TaxID=2713176 RepID=UPI00141F19D1|nr:DUF4331 family protein [Thalassoroseus pseudoceratinae]
MRIWKFAATLCTCLTPLIGLQAADHLDSPSVAVDGRMDLNDLYAFQSPENPDNTVIIATVNPRAGVLANSPGSFNSRGIYTIHIDNNGDAVSNVSFSFYFSRARGNRPQRVIVLRENNRVAASGSTGRTINVRGGGKLIADLYEDPFFFDSDVLGSGADQVDNFAGFNVTAIVLEIPSSTFGGQNVGIWATTRDRGGQFDRVGRPAINTVLIPGPRKDEFNQSDPADDLADFGADVEASITGLSNATNAMNLTPILLPDILTFDTSSAGGFLNGRRLEDDVIDAELNLLTAGGLTGDGIDENDAQFLDTFPYLAAPN